LPNVQPGSQVETCNGKDDDCNGLFGDVQDIKTECNAAMAGAQNVVDWQCQAGKCKVAAPPRVPSTRVHRCA